MAILKKRTSSKQIPEARALNRAPLNSLIQGVNKSPSIFGGASSLTSTGSSPSITTPTGAPKTSLTSSTGSKPAVTSTTSKTPTSITTSPSTTPKQTIKPNVSKPNSTTSKVVNALSGAAIGAGTKMLIDKITSKPSMSKTPQETVKENAALESAILKDKASAKRLSADKKASDLLASSNKKVAEELAGVKPPVEDEFMTDKDGNIYKIMPDGSEVLVQKAEKPVEDEFMTDAKGNIYKIMPDGTEVLYRAAEVEEIRLAQEDGLSAGKTMEYANGTTITAMDDGNGGLMYVRGGYDKETGLGPKGGGTRGLGGASTEVVNTVEDADGTVTVTYADGSTKTIDKDFNISDTKPSDGTTTKVLDDGSVITYDANGEFLFLTGEGGLKYDSEGTIISDSGLGEDTALEYYQDGDRNYYTMNSDGGYDLAFYADGSVYDDTYANTGGDTTVADTSYYDEETGQTWNLSDSGMWTLEGDDSTYYDDSLYADNTEYTDDSDYLYAGNDNDTNYDDYDYSGEEYAKRGGLTTMMKQGGVAHMADGGYMPEGAVDNEDGTYTIGRFTYNMMTDEYLYSTDDGQITNVNSDAVYSPDDQENYYTTDSLGNIFKNGEIFMNSEDVPSEIRSAGGGNRSWYSDLGSALSKGFEGATKLGSDALSGISGALGTTAGAAGAGALVATLLGSDFGNGSENQNQGLDMSKVGVINPRTTDFGIGPTKFVGYEDYGTGGGDYAPNEELLRNLNAPGFNPVNEGDYGYEDVPAEEPKMASGGLSSMATPVSSYYTFGQPADILANLGMRPQPPMNSPDMMSQVGQQQQPQQTQQQGLPQQMPQQMAQQTPQGMPQQGMMPQQQGMAPSMRRGGLPHVSDVPITEGRMDFRRGSAVYGAGDGQSDDIPAMLADGEYVIDAETVAQIGNGSTKAGAQALDKFRESIRAHKRSAPINKIPPKTKALTSYLKGAR